LPQEYAPKAVIQMLNEIKNEIINVRGNCDTEVDQMVLDFPVLADYAYITDESTTIFANTLPKLEPNLARLQGCWAASENHEDDEPNFLCAMPATWDKNMKGYYVVEINGNTLLYRWFHPSGNNGSRNGDYKGWIEEEEYKIKKVTEVSSDKHQTQFTLDLISNDMPKQISIVVYDNSDIYKNSFMVNDFPLVEQFKFVKLNDDQLIVLMNTMHDIAISRMNIDEPLFPYVGMSKDSLEKSPWGKPDDINIKTIKDNTFEQWCYPNNRYVYVENGYVKTVQM
jgi:hypothetical protein